MKQIVLCFTAILLLFTGCNKDCIIKRPKSVKPIDWENYNDVYTVYWNLLKFCSEPSNDEGKDIKIYGWIFQGLIYPDGKPLPVDSKNFVLISNEEDIFYANYCTRGGVGIAIGSVHRDSLNFFDLQSKLDTSDITKKCFIKGKIGFICLHTGKCSQSEPRIYLQDVSDIYFE